MKLLSLSDVELRMYLKRTGLRYIVKSEYEYKGVFVRDIKVLGAGEDLGLYIEKVLSGKEYTTIRVLENKRG